MLNKKRSFKKFVTGNGFYILTGVALIAVVATAIILPKQGKGDVTKEPDKYAINRPVAADDMDELRVPTIDPTLSLEDEYDITDDNELESSDKADLKEKDQVAVNETKTNTDTTSQEEITSETFKSTTSTKEELFHADNDLFAWPIDEPIIYDYSDNDQGKSFINPTLDRTMRSFGLFLKAKAKDEVRVAAKGKVIAITDYPTADMPPAMDYPSVGLAVIVDHGNEWKTVYGLHQGQATVKVGDHVQLGQVIGTVGKASRDFTLTGENLYFQILKNDLPINPQDKLDYALDIGVRP